MQPSTYILEKRKVVRIRTLEFPLPFFFYHEAVNWNSVVEPIWRVGSEKLMFLLNPLLGFVVSLNIG